jgi:hypothetical protein
MKILTIPTYPVTRSTFSDYDCVIVLPISALSMFNLGSFYAQFFKLKADEPKLDSIRFDAKGLYLKVVQLVNMPDWFDEENGAVESMSYTITPESWSGLQAELLDAVPFVSVTEEYFKFDVYPKEVGECRESEMVGVNKMLRGAR